VRDISILKDTIASNQDNTADLLALIALKFVVAIFYLYSRLFAGDAKLYSKVIAEYVSLSLQQSLDIGSQTGLKSSSWLSVNKSAVVSLTSIDRRLFSLLTLLTA
jgi:hypothetical protein